MALADTARLIAVLELKDEFSGRINNAERQLSKFDKGFDSVNTRSRKIGTQIGTGILRTAAAVTAAAGTSAIFLGKAISAASDLNETVSKTKVVFGAGADAVLKFGKTSAAALGLSEQAADEAAATYGNLFVSMGITGTKAGEMSVKLVKLAGDLASFNNVSPEDALLALRSGLVGEVEPLRKFGVNLSEATLKAEALKLGLIKTTASTADLKKASLDVAKAQAAAKDAIAKHGKSSLEAQVALNKVALAQEKLNAAGKKVPAVLDPAIKAQAAYALILEQTKTAQGDFDRTSGGLANQLRILRANFTNLLATIGTPVLPKVAKVFQTINDEIKKNQPEVEKLGESIAGLFSDENLKQGVQILEGAFDTFKATAPIVAQSAKATFGFVQAAVGLFKSLPAPLQGLLVGGVALNKLTGGLVTTIAGGLVEVIGKSRGGSPANPVFVSDISGGLGGGVGVPAKAGLGAKLVNAATKVFIIGAAVGTFAELKGFLEDQTKANKTQEAGLSEQTALFVKSASLSDMKSSLAALQDTSKLSLGEQAALLLNIDGVNDSILAQQKILKDAIAARESAAVKPINLAQGSNANVREDRNSLHADLGALGGKITDDLNGVKDILRGVKAEFSAATKQLAHPKSQDELVHAAQELEKLLLSGRGGAVETAHRIDLLRKQLEKVHDPKTKAALEAKLVKIEGLLPGRQFAARELAKADSILKSHESGNKKIVDLKAVEQALLTRGLPHAASVIREKEEEVRKAAIAAGNHSADAIRRKRLSVTVNNPLTVSTYITGRSVASTIRKSSKFGVQVE